MIAGGRLRLVLEYPPHPIEALGQLLPGVQSERMQPFTAKCSGVQAPEPAGRWAGKTLGIWGQIKETRDGARLG